jgi:very-short-patch-repair endonuclease
LRGRQVEGCKFRRQHPFDDFILDFACLERSLVVEVDGGQHTDEIDRQRTQTLQRAGFTVLRFWNNDVFRNTDGVLQVIRENLVARATPSPPNPPLEGEGQEQMRQRFTQRVGCADMVLSLIGGFVRT